MADVSLNTSVVTLKPFWNAVVSSLLVEVGVKSRLQNETGFIVSERDVGIAVSLSE